MKMPRKPQDELLALLDRSKASFRRQMRLVAEATARGDNDSRFHRLDDLRILAGQTMALADLYGRRRSLMWQKYAQAKVAAEMRPEVFAQHGGLGIVYDQPFREAIADFKARTPELADTAEAVAEAYTQRHAFACVRSADAYISAKVQEKITAALSTGSTTEEAVKQIIAETEDWSNAYAEMVYRTNVHSAYASGEVAQAMDPVALEVLPAWEYQAVGDAGTRDNHMAADGMIAAKRDPIWQTWYPPTGYNCRCSVVERDVYWLEDRGMMTASGGVKASIPAGIASGSVQPDKNFNRRSYL